ncbi:hypothetical protein F8M41_004606 [Gigaspora margarita]|uniref:Uncharacterized protein n=1 Tax=Gigaspora margarita TaxID=4874 RepID=A0A8H4ERQ7_GIGMA|nr:hypothetical protein F8M41_004606 [Gigaspora margarita]
MVNYFAHYHYTILALPDINEIFDIDKEVQEVNMNLDENNVDNILDFILDAKKYVGHMWEVLDDDALAPEKTLEAERVKYFLLPASWSYISSICKLFSMEQWNDANEVVLHSPQ